MLDKYLAFFASPCKPELSFLIEASKNLLSPKRFTHVQGVHKAALDFAYLFSLNNEDQNRLELAVWFHDFVKGLDINEQLLLIRHFGVEIPLEAHKAPSVYHALLDAWIIPHIFKVEDEQIYEAVYHHTTGHPAMGMIGQLLFLADYCEEGRGIDVRAIVQLLPTNLNEALYQVIKAKIIYVLQKDKYLHRASLAYFHFLLDLTHESQ